MKVYITTRGQYSDYRLDRVFSTKENAQLYLNSITKQIWNSINTQILQAQIDSIIPILRQGFNIYHGIMDIDGNTSKLTMKANYIETHKNNVYNIKSIRQYSDGKIQNTCSFVQKTRQNKTQSPVHVKYEDLPLRTDFKEYNVIQFYVLAKSEQHAVKIVNEKRIQFIANNIFTRQILKEYKDYIMDVQHSMIDMYSQ